MSKSGINGQYQKAVSSTKTRAGEVLVPAPLRQSRNKGTGYQYQPLGDSLDTTAGTTKRAKKKKPKPAPVFTPHNCTVLAVDPGEESGWSIIDRGRLRAWGTCDVFGAEPAQVIARALTYPGPLVAVLERPFGVRSQSSTGIGTGDRIWRQRLKEARCGRVVRVYPPTWRARVLGRDPITGKAWASAKREDVRVEESRVARIITLSKDIHPDAAAATLIGWWGCYSGEVGEKLLTPAMRRAAALTATPPGPTVVGT